MDIAHSPDCAIWNPDASTEKACDCGAATDSGLAGSGHTQAPERALREEALSMAIELFGGETSAEDAADLVAAAKVFEAYLKGE
jgi:hypothetical protein